MSSTTKTPAGPQRLAHAILPTTLVEAVRKRVRRRFYRSISMVSRDSAPLVWFRRHVLHLKPVLYHFEVHITDHCNLNCKGCAHFSNLCPPTFADLAEFEKDMNAMGGLFSDVKQMYLLGGEPLLHPQVADFVRVARKALPKTRISLMTNGVLVTRMGEGFWKALAESNVVLLADSYPINLPVDEINRLGREHGATVEWTEPRKEFFKIPIDAAGGHDAAESFRGCQGFNNCPIIRDGRLYPCAYAAFGDVFGERFGLEGLAPGDADSISIRDDPDPEKVMEFLKNPIHWCGFCDMDSRSFYEWGRSKRELDEWTNSVADGPAAS